MAKRIQIILLVFFVLAGIRVYLIYRERNAPAAPVKQAPANPNFSEDSYVVPTQVHADDLKSAKAALDGKTVWVKAGYQIQSFPVSGGHVDYKRPAGLLAPMQKLAISNVIQATPPTAQGEEVSPGVRIRQEQVLAVFHPEGENRTYAAPIGQNRGGDYTFYINDAFFLEDPHGLYKHWPQDMWSAIDQHQAKKGMNELQVSLALGAGTPQAGSDIGDRTMQYDNNGHPVKVTFEHGHATDVQNVSGS